MKQLITPAALVLAMLAWGAACGDDGEDASADGSADGEPDLPETPAELGALHNETAALLGAGPTGLGSCSVSSCHGTAAEAELEFMANANLRELFVGVASCEAPSLDLVEPGAPERSWLWIKLTGELEDQSSGDLKADPSWGEPNPACEDAGGFGKRMPRVSPWTLPDADLQKIRTWILAGAPGPDGTK